LPEPWSHLTAISRERGLDSNGAWAVNASSTAMTASLAAAAYYVNSMNRVSENDDDETIYCVIDRP
jgi:hypothetical protein